MAVPNPMTDVEPLPDLRGAVAALCRALRGMMPHYPVHDDVKVALAEAERIVAALETAAVPAERYTGVLAEDEDDDDEEEDDGK